MLNTKAKQIFKNNGQLKNIPYSSKDVRNVKSDIVQTRRSIDYAIKNSSGFNTSGSTTSPVVGRVLSSDERLRSLIIANINETKLLRQEIQTLKNINKNITCKNNFAETSQDHKELENKTKITPAECSKVFDIPCKSIDSLQAFEAKIRDNVGDSYLTLEKLLDEISSAPLGKYLYDCLKYCMTDNLATKCAVNGKSDKLEVNDFTFIKLISDCALKKFPETDSFESMKIIRKWFHYAHHRCGRVRSYPKSKNSRVLRQKIQKLTIKYKPDTVPENKGKLIPYIESAPEIKQHEIKDVQTTHCDNTQEVIPQAPDVIAVKPFIKISEIPCKNLNRLLAFETRIKEDKFSSSAFENLLEGFSITTIQEYVTDCLKSCFTDVLASKCSLDGSDNKLAVRNFKFINLIIEHALKKFPLATSIEAFKIMCKWFRYASNRCRRALGSTMPRKPIYQKPNIKKTTLVRQKVQKLKLKKENVPDNNETEELKSPAENKPGTSKAATYLSGIPCSSLSGLLAFDGKLKENKKALSAFVKLLDDLPLSSWQKFIYDAFKLCISDALACKCSLGGRKNKFAVRDLKIAIMIKETALQKFPGITLFDINKVMCKWFHYANDRCNRELSSTTLTTPPKKNFKKSLIRSKIEKLKNTNICDVKKKEENSPENPTAVQVLDIPCKKVAGLLAFEAKLQGDVTSISALQNILEEVPLTISLQKYTFECMRTCLTDSLSSKCTMNGSFNKLAVQDFKFIQLIREHVLKKFPEETSDETMKNMSKFLRYGSHRDKRNYPIPRKLISQKQTAIIRKRNVKLTHKKETLKSTRLVEKELEIPQLESQAETAPENTVTDMHCEITQEIQQLNNQEEPIPEKTVSVTPCVNISEIPCSNLTSLLAFDTKIQEDTICFSAFENLMQQIPIINLQQYINDCLKSCITNSLATQCSFDGRNNKFAVRNFTFISLIIEHALVVFPGSTTTDAISIIAKWLSYANHRGSRKWFSPKPRKRKFQLTLTKKSTLYRQKIQELKSKRENLTESIIPSTSSAEINYEVQRIENPEETAPDNDVAVAPQVSHETQHFEIEEEIAPDNNKAPHEFIPDAETETQSRTEFEPSPDNNIMTVVPLEINYETQQQQQNQEDISTDYSAAVSPWARILGIPCNNLGGLLAFESRIQEDMTTFSAFESFLEKIPLTSLQTYVVACLKSCITEPLALNCSMDGSNEKLAVGDFALISLIVEGARTKFPETNALEIINIIKKWFQYAKNRQPKNRTTNLE